MSDEIGREARELSAAATSVLEADIDAVTRDEVRKRVPGEVRRALPAIAVSLFVAVALIVGGAIYLFYTGFDRVDANSANISDLKHEEEARIDQTCLLFEGDYETAVSQLENTYRYLTQLKPDELKSTINQFIIVRLPATERDARGARGPAYCDAPGVGLPEPDPPFPKRPPDLPIP